jgi:hypothetical protein
MRRLSVASLAITLMLGGGAVAAIAAIAAIAGCGREDRPRAPQFRTILARDLRLVGSPAPADRELTVQYVAGALLWEPQPVARVEVDQNPERIVVRLFLNERVPAADEHVPNIATVRTATVALDQPLGRATVLDGSATPPAPMPPR